MSEVNLNVELFTKTKLDEWEKLNKVKTGFFTTTLDLSSAIKFIITALDEAIKFAQTNLGDSQTKKDFVLSVISRLYDTIIAPKLPTFLYFWSSTIKDIVVNKLISALIDYVVGLYKKSGWAN